MTEVDLTKGLHVSVEYVVLIDDEPFNHSFNDFESAFETGIDFKTAQPNSNILIVGQFNKWQEGVPETIELVDLHTVGADDIPCVREVWIDMYNNIKSSLDKIGGAESTNSELTPIQQAEKIEHYLQYITGYRVWHEYTETYPYFDFEVWTQDNKYGLRIFFGHGDKIGKLQAEFYGYRAGDDGIYEDLTLDYLSQPIM